MRFRVNLESTGLPKKRYALPKQTLKHRHLPIFATTVLIPWDFCIKVVRYVALLPNLEKMYFTSIAIFVLLSSHVLGVDPSCTTGTGINGVCFDPTVGNCISGFSFEDDADCAQFGSQVDRDIQI